MSQFSKTALKTIRRLGKNQLVEMVVSISNYAENQKAQNMILLGMVAELKEELKKHQPAEETKDVAST